MLGDYHHPERDEVGGAVAAYCGSTERASADEEEARGYNVFEFGDGVFMERRAVETRDFVTVEAELLEGGTDEVIERTREREVEDAVVLVDVTGDSEAPVVQSEVEEAVLERGALVTRVNDRRDTEDGTTEDVEFADPDTAVRDRIEEMELTDAGREIDGLVRDGTVARTRIAEEVEERVEELLDGDDADDRGDETTEQSTLGDVP
jgi:DNA repair exonuclease SbcCD nuclease subunit